jgi:sortase A
MDETTLVAAPAPEPPAAEPMTFGDKVRFVLRGIGQTLITFGVVVLLFVVYEVWVTNWFSERENHKLLKELQQEWALPDSGLNALKVGDAMGVLYIPRLGQDYKWAIVQGSEVPDQDQLAKGPAHYGKTALPGHDGNFAVAGHRVGKGEPFLNLDQLRSGDAVVVATRDAWYVYRVLGTPAGKNPQTVRAPVADYNGIPISLPGREIVDPGNGAVLLPVPDNPQVTKGPNGRWPDHLMTMTTCHPKFTAAERMIVYASLQTTIRGSGDTMPDQIKALYTEVKS